MNLNEKKEELLNENLCNHCLGRQFARLGHNLQNKERGAIVRDKNTLTQKDFTHENIPANITDFNNCDLCGGIFNQIDKYVDLVLKRIDNYEINTILIGTQVPDQIEQKEKYYRQKYGEQYSNHFKSEFNRLIGKKVQAIKDICVDFERPDLTAIIDIKNEKINLQVNSLLIYGQYNKYSRELPQTVLFCYNCYGKGCKECNQTGLEYQESVQQLIQFPLIKMVQGKDAKFHGAGREDIDVRCFAKREFVLEILHPIKRNIDYLQAENKINAKQSKIEVFNLHSTPKNKIKQLKEKRADKTYSCLVSTSAPIQSQKLRKLNQIKGTIEQKTPQRVLESRTDKIRRKQVYQVFYEKFSDSLIELIIKAEAGTYIKELITGDENRTNPNVAKIWDCQARCAKLDLIDIDK